MEQEEQERSITSIAVIAAAPLGSETMVYMVLYVLSVLERSISTMSLTL